MKTKLGFAAALVVAFAVSAVWSSTAAKAEGIVIGGGGGGGCTSDICGGIGHGRCHDKDYNYVSGLSSDRQTVTTTLSVSSTDSNGNVTTNVYQASNTSLKPGRSAIAKSCSLNAEQAV